MISLQASATLLRRFESATYGAIVTGFLLSAVMAVVSGPMWPLDLILPASVPLAIVRQVLFGLAAGLQLVGGFSAGVTEAAAAGMPITIATTSAFSAAISTAYAVG